MRGKKLVVDEVPIPAPGPGEALVKTLACGICGSDLHTLKHAERLVEGSRKSGAPFVMDLKRDIVMGHEFCAEVVDYGPQTQKHLKPGTRVCAMPVLIRSTGVEAVGYSNENPGGYGELMRLTELLLLEVPNGLSTERAALTEPMAVGYHAVQKARLQKDDAPLVIGCGPVGLAVIAALKLIGASPIVAADFSSRRRELARQMGADFVVDPREKSPYDSWKELAAYTDPATAPKLPPWLPGPALRPAVIFECVGVPGVIESVMAAARQRAHRRGRRMHGARSNRAADRNQQGIEYPVCAWLLARRICSDSASSRGRPRQWRSAYHRQGRRRWSREGVRGSSLAGDARENPGRAMA